MFLAFALSALAVGRPYRRFRKSGFGPATFLTAAQSLVILVIAVGLFAFICQRLCRRLGGAASSRDLWLASVVAGLCLAAMSAGAQIVVKQTITNPYGIVMNILGLMVWVSIAIRVILALAVWAAADPVGRRRGPDDEFTAP
jgi:hypothetical protein